MNYRKALDEAVERIGGEGRVLDEAVERIGGKGRVLDEAVEAHLKCKFREAYG